MTTMLEARARRLRITAAPVVSHDWLFYLCYGEFGHELMAAGLLFGMLGKYKQVTVCTRPGRQALYYPRVSDVRFHDLRCEGMCQHATPATAPDAAAVMALQPAGAECLMQFDVYSVRGQERFRRDAMPVKYGERRPEYKGAVILHARNRPHAPERNWPQHHWNRLARWLLREGYAKRLVCVGSLEAALPVEGAFDLRGAGLHEQMDAMASARFGVGPSSGPMHLLENCGCPLVVWCGGRVDERRMTRQRYERRWNPHGTPVAAYEYGSWQPTVATVQEWVERFVAEQVES